MSYIGYSVHQKSLIEAEASARASAIIAEQNDRATAIANAVNAEASARDTAIANAVSAEATARDTAIASAVAGLGTGDVSQAILDSVVSNLQVEDSNLNASIASHISDRVATDQQHNINISSLNNNDTLIKDRLKLVIDYLDALSQTYTIEIDGNVVAPPTWLVLKNELDGIAYVNPSDPVDNSGAGDGGGEASSGWSAGVWDTLLFGLIAYAETPNQVITLPDGRVLNLQSEGGNQVVFALSTDASQTFTIDTSDPTGLISGASNVVGYETGANVMELSRTGDLPALPNPDGAYDVFDSSSTLVVSFTAVSSMSKISVNGVDYYQQAVLPSSIKYESADNFVITLGMDNSFVATDPALSTGATWAQA